MISYVKHLGSTPQTEPLVGQVANSAGGHSFPVDHWTHLDRFLILGSEGGSYYASERSLTLGNTTAVEQCVKENGLRTVARIVEISDQGRVPKNDPALLALAIAAKRGDLETRQAALVALPRVARIGTHLFHFAEYIKLLGGWGRGTTRAFANWYLDKNPEGLALQAIKYRSRDGWSHRDILRKSHPKTQDPRTNEILRWMARGGSPVTSDGASALIAAFETAKTLTSKSDVKKLCGLINEARLPHECIPNEMKQYPAVWEALLPHMGLTALIRNLGKMTSVGLLAPLSQAAKKVQDRLSDTEALKTARIHPLNVLVAQKIYSQGHGDKGNLTWEPVQTIEAALDLAFYGTFKSVEPTGKRTMLAIDISGSMDGAQIAGMPLSAREGSAAMALVTANTEPEWGAFGFCTQFSSLKIAPQMRLNDVIRYMEGLTMGATDCSLPMVWAEQNKVPVDTFCVYTDSETFAGSIHPVTALKKYRQRMGIPAKLIVVGMTANEFSIADSKDGGMLDVVGFDTAAPAIMADFAR